MSRARNALSLVLVRTDYAWRTELEKFREATTGAGGAQQFKYVNMQSRRPGPTFRRYRHVRFPRKRTLRTTVCH